MSEAKLGILLTADTTQASGNISILEKQLDRLQKLASLPNLSFKQQERLNQMLLQTQGNITKFTKATELANPALNKLTTTSNQSTVALTNFGRVVQDAPFGFLGIANNLNPLLESFQRLKATSGSSSAAFKELGASLTGPAGIGIALSVVSSLLIVFGDKLFGAGKAAKETKDANDKLAESISGDIVKLTSLVAIAQNVKASTEDRANALKAINQEYGKYLPNLEKERVTLNNIRESYESIIDSLLKQAVLKGLQDEIEKAVKKTASSILSLENEEQKRITTQHQAEQRNKAQKDSISTLARGYNDLSHSIKDGYLANVRNEQVLQGQAKAAGTYDERLKNLKETLKKDLLPLFGIMERFNFEDLDITLNKNSKSGDNDIIARAKRIFEAYKDIISLRLNILPEDGLKVQLEKAKVFLKDYKDFIENFFSSKTKGHFINIAPPTLISEGDVEAPQAAENLAHSFEEVFSKELNDYFNSPFVTDFTLLEAMKPKVKTKAEELAESLTTAFNSALQNGFENGFATLGEGLGDIISGKNFGAGLINVIGSLLKAIGQALIKYGIVKEGLDKLLGPAGIFIPGGVAIGLGVLAIAAGQIFQNFGGFREKGGPVIGGKSYVVGERGPEIFVPSSTGSIIPNGKTGQLSGGEITVHLQGEFVNRGNDMVLAISRTQKYQLGNV